MGGNNERESEAAIRVLSHITLLLEVLDHPTVLSEGNIIMMPDMDVRGTTFHQRELVERVLLPKLGAQRRGCHRHDTALRNVEGACRDLQINVLQLRGGIATLHLRHLTGWCFLSSCLLCVHRGGGRRLSRQRRQSQQRRQTQNQGSTRNPSVRATSRLKERGHHYPT